MRMILAAFLLFLSAGSGFLAVQLLPDIPWWNRLILTLSAVLLFAAAIHQIVITGVEDAQRMAALRAAQSEKAG